MSTFNLTPTISQNVTTVYHSHQLAMAHVSNAIQHFPSTSTPKIDILNKWQRKIKCLSDSKFIPYEHLFAMTIGFPTGIFSYLFDFTDILSYIKTEEVQPISLDVSMMTAHVERTVWNQVQDDTPYPAVVLETPLIPKGYLLSGHKEILRAEEKKIEKVDVFVLTEMEYIHLMQDNISKAMYMFHRDLQTLLTSQISPSYHALFFSQADTFLKVTK